MGGSLSYEKFLDVCSSPYGYNKVGRFLRKGKNVNERDELGRTPLHICLEKFHETHDNLYFLTIDKLLEYKADVCAIDCNKVTPIHLACNTKYMCVKTLFKMLDRVETGVKLFDKNGDTPLHFACRIGSPGTIRSLLFYEADPLIKNNYGQTAIESTPDCFKDIVKNALFAKY